MYGLTPWIISPIDPPHCDLHETHLFHPKFAHAADTLFFLPTTPPTPVCINNGRRRGHKEYIRRLGETYIPSRMHILCREKQKKQLPGEEKALRNMSRRKKKTDLLTKRLKTEACNFQTAWMMIQLRTARHPTLKQKSPDEHPCDWTDCS